MPTEFRDPRLIQEELSDLRAILQKEEALISKYPEHTELLLAHSDTKKREQELISELEAQLSYEMPDEKSNYWVVGNDDLGAYGVDSTVDKAKEMFLEDLHIEYITYKDLNDDDLTEKAVELKRKLIDLFEGA